MINGIEGSSTKVIVVCRNMFEEFIFIVVNYKSSVYHYAVLSKFMGVTDYEMLHYIIIITSVFLFLLNYQKHIFLYLHHKWWRDGIIKEVYSTY